MCDKNFNFTFFVLAVIYRSPIWRIVYDIFRNPPVGRFVPDDAFVIAGVQGFEPLR